MKLLLSKLFREVLTENRYQDQALDNLSKVGSFNKLSELDKLVLLSASGDFEKCKHINLLKIYQENGGQFPNLKIKVKIKPLNEQPVNHEFSKEETGKEGYLFAALHYDEVRQPYVTVQFDDLEHLNKQGDTAYKTRPIMLNNLYPIGYGDVPSDFVKHQAMRDEIAKQIRGYFDSEDDF